MEGEQLIVTESTGHTAEFSDYGSPGYDGPERRGKPRLYGHFAAMERDVEREGEPFEVNAVVTNISASGLYLFLRRAVQTGSTLFVVTRLATVSDPDSHGPEVAMHGRVLRVESQPNGEYGVALKIIDHDFV